MLFLTTGGVGAGKTICTLKDVRERQVAESRPVYYYHIKLKGDALTWGWQELHPHKWQEAPSGSIIFVDEAHKYFPKRGGLEKEPEYIEAIAEHRHSGKDFYIITQHPADLDIFIRRRVSAPGWHRHLKRRGAAQVVSVLEFNSVNSDPERKDAPRNALVSTRPYPVDMFDCYDSAEMHTAKYVMPGMVKYALAGAVAVLVLFGYGAWQFTAHFKKSAPELSSAKDGVSQAKRSESGPTGQGASAHQSALTAGEWMALRQPRIPGLPNTAPAYDGQTAPVDAPYPAACLEGVRPGTKGRECTCWTQQGTRLQTPPELCTQIVRNGYFMEWHKEESHGLSSGGRVGESRAAPAGVAVAAAMPVSTNPDVLQAPTERDLRDGGIGRAMRTRDWSRN